MIHDVVECNKLIVKNPATPFGYMLLIEETLTTAATELRTEKFDPKNELLVVVDIKGFSASTYPRFLFNGSSAAAYGYSLQNHLGAATQAASGTSLFLTQAGSAQAFQGTYHIKNILDEVKALSGTGCQQAGGAGIPVALHNAGVWNQNDRINQVSITTGGANTIDVGSRIIVYGSLERKPIAIPR